VASVRKREEDIPVRALPRVLAALVVAAPLCAQQVADPNFDARVDKPAFVTIHPKVLFDEGHHNVHKSELTYKAFVALLRNDGCVVDVNGGALTADRLRGYRLLVIAGALGAPLADQANAQTPAFTEGEVKAVREWVRRGGGLLLLTDHEPVASSEESLVRAFGVTPMKEVVVDEDHRFEPYVATNVLASVDNGLLARHPITHGIERVAVFGGQSLVFPESAAVLIGVSRRARARSGGTLGNGQAGALRFGRGRVVITGDMGMLSAQLITENGVTGKWGMNVPGIDNRRLVLNVTRWLLGMK
jgi:hypothetical protein